MRDSVVVERMIWSAVERVLAKHRRHNQVENQESLDALRDALSDCVIIMARVGRGDYEPEPASGAEEPTP
jgi:hypothetical protein